MFNVLKTASFIHIRMFLVLSCTYISIFYRVFLSDNQNEKSRAVAVGSFLSNIS